MNYDEIKSKFLGDLGTEILEALPCGLFVASHTAGIEGIRIIYMNQVFLDCIGYHREEFEATGRDMGAVVMPQDNIAARQQLHDALKSKGKIILQDYRIHRPNGECNHVLCGMKNIEKVGNSHFLVATYMKLDEFATKEKAIVEQRYKMEELTSRLSRMIQNLPSGCAVVQGADRLELISGNAEFFRPLGYTLEEIQLLPGDLKDIVYPSDVQQLKKAAEEVLRNKESKECEIRIVDKMGRTRWLSIKIRYYYQQHGIPYFLIACWDIHERKLVEEELYLQTERYQLMEEMNNEIPFEYDVKKRALLIPKKFDFMLSEEFNNQDYNLSRENIEHFFHPEDEMGFWKTIDRASLVPEEGSMEYRINIARREKNPEYAWFSTSYKSVLGVSGKIVRILGRTADISKEKTERNEMAERLRKDPLTGILNKVATKTTVEEFLTSEPVGIHALFLIDIDNFKEINDTFGHLFGDSALVTITEKIKVLFRSNDVVGRIGGDEFVAFMKHTSPQQVRIKAQAICDAVKQEYNGAKEQMEISCSVGVALYDQKKDSYVTLFSKADRAMYQAKIAGKNQYCLGESAEPLWHVQKKSNIESRGGRYKAGESQDMNFLSEAFLLLSHAKDINNSLNLLMERIGQQYDLGMVVVLKCNRDREELFQTNCWTRKSGILKQPTLINNYKYWEGFLKTFHTQGGLCINDVRNDKDIPNPEHELLDHWNVRALVNCSFSYFDREEGYVTFCDLEKPRQWNEFEKETFLELSRLFSVFVALLAKQEEDQKAIRHLKKRDPLTGLYNEEAFKARAQKKLREWKENQQYAVVFSDINDFSYINDNFGYDAGNEILKNFALQIQNGENIISGRLYSDLFISLMWGSDKDIILHYIVRSSTNFSRQQKKKYAGTNIKLSTGVYFIESPEEKLDIAIENANLTRKSIKGTESTFCRVYEKTLRQQREIEKKINAAFQRALEEERFHVFIQPKFYLQEWKMFGGEALVRWKKQSGKLEAPGYFIPALEKSGYIVELDFYVYEQVLKYFKKWREEGRELPVISVNFSRKHFEGDGIYLRIVKLAEQYHVPHEKIEIEITESLVAIKYEQVKQEMQQLRRAGFRVAIDDFGTGYSSLSMLLDIPADVVKIDKSFLNRENRFKEKEFVKTMGELVRSVKEEVIFEGIESKEQLQFLVNCGFRYGQGFLFSHPLPLGVFEEKYMKKGENY